MQFTDQPVHYTLSYNAPWETLKRKGVPIATRIMCQKTISDKPAQYGKEFHGSISREEAQDLVSQCGDGGYLVRESQRAPGSYSLTLRCGGDSMNYKLHYSDGMHFIGEKRFETLNDLVNDGLKTMYLETYPEVATGNEQKYCALYDYHAIDDDEVSFWANDIITEVNVIDEGWMEGRVERTGQCGLLPSNYVKKISRRDGGTKDEQQNNDTQDSKKGERQFATLYPVNDGWEVMHLETYAEVAIDKEQKYCALYDYAAADDDEVSFWANDIITEVKVIDEGWMEGRVERTGQYGMLPSNYVEKFSRKDGSSEDEKQNSDKQDAEKAPLEILARGPLALQAYQKALLEGQTRVKRVPLMLIGQGESGKTSLKRSLKGERFDSEEKSTTGIELDPSYCKVSTESWKVGVETRDTYSDTVPISYEQSTAEFVARNILEEAKNPKSNELKCKNTTVDKPVVDRKEQLSESSDTPCPWGHEISPDSVDAVSEVPDEIATAVDKLPDTPCPSDHKISPDSVDDVSEVPNEIATAVEKLLQMDDSGQDEEDIYSLLWDFGGQSVYYVTHPLFLTTRAIYFLVYNLSWNPNGTASPKVKYGLYKDVIDVFCDRSNKDYLDIWMSSVSSLVSHYEETTFSNILPEKLPPVFLVCTHSDKPFQNKCPVELARAIYGELKAKSHGKHLVDFFVVDNTKSGSGEECPEVTRLRRKVLDVAKKLPQMKEVFPIKWLKFEKALQSLTEDGLKWISIDDARRIAEEKCRIASDEEFQALLNLLHDQRILIHFDDTPALNRMVILDPQWLVDVFKKVIATKPNEKKGRKFEESWLKLEEKGILEEKLLQHVWSPLFDSEETSHSLVALMEKFCLLCPWPSSAESKSLKEYLVPSMLMFPPKEDISNLIESAGIPSLFVKFKSGQVPPGLFPRLVLMVYQWCTKELSCQSSPQLHHNFARFFTHPAEGCSLVLLYHPSFIEVVVHKEGCTAKMSTTSLPGMNLSSESSYDAFQTNVARTMCRQLGLMLECMRKQFHWLKSMAYEKSVCCPVCCKQGAANYCRSHNVRGCKQEECLHFWSESQLRDCQGPVICTKSAVAGDFRVPVKLFGPWFEFVDEQKQGAIECDGKALPCKKGDSAQALVLPSGVLEALQLRTHDASGVVARLQESLSLKQASLERPDPETKQKIRFLCMKANTTNRLDVVKKLREIVPAGTTGPLLPEALDVENIPIHRRRELTINLCGGDEWKPFAERLGLSPAEIRFLDNRLLNPCDAALAHSRGQGYISSVGDLYDVLVDCGLPVMADLL